MWNAGLSRATTFLFEGGGRPLSRMEGYTSADAAVPQAMDASGSADAVPTERTPLPVPRRRVPWAQLLRRLLRSNVFACRRCSTPKQPVAGVVPVFLTEWWSRLRESTGQGRPFMPFGARRRRGFTS